MFSRCAPEGAAGLGTVHGVFHRVEKKKKDQKKNKCTNLESKGGANDAQEPWRGSKKGQIKKKQERRGQKGFVVQNVFVGEAPWKPIKDAPYGS